MEQEPRSVGSGIYHGAGFEVTKTVALESGESASGAQLESGQTSVALILHAGEFTLPFTWEPEIARKLGELLIQQADLIERS